jgi:cyclopropane-fatty-acyl-phospholipid synthase
LNLGNDLWHRLRVNTRAGSRRNIRYHYDLSNDFFALFLDETMTYSSAVFAHAGQPLAEAQRQKFRRLAEKALIGPEDHVLEIGCGWGGFATFAGLTLRRWREAFLANLDAARALGFDERFIRMWDYYLAISEAGFATGITQDLQVVLEKGRGIR